MPGFVFQIVPHTRPLAFKAVRTLVSDLFPFRRLTGDDRRLLIGLAVVGVVQGFGQAHLSALLPFTRLTLGLDQSGMSLVLSVTRIASVGAVAFSLWGDRRGRRVPLLTALAVLIAASSVTAFVNDAGVFTVTQSVSRIASTAVGTLGVVLIAESISVEFRAFGIGFYAAAGALGGGIGQTMLLVADTGPEAWRFAFGAMAPLSLLLVWLRRIPESPIALRRRRVPISEFLRGEKAFVFWVSGIAALLAAALPALALAFTNERLINELGLSAPTATAIALGGGTLGGLGFWVGGRLADVWGRRPTTALALTLGAVGGIWIFNTVSLVALTCGVFVGAFGTFAYLPAASAHRTELFATDNRSTATSAGAYLATIGSALALGTGRFAIDAFGLSATVSMMALPTAVAIGLTWLLPETKGQVFSPDRT